MKTLSLIAVSTLLGSVVSGQMIAPEKADLGSDFQEAVRDIVPKHPNPREIPESVPPPPRNQPLPKGKPEHKGPKGPPVPLRGQDPAPNVAVPPVVHVTKTKTQIIYPTPNEQNWKNLPTAQGHRGKVVAEFYIDDMGHYREIKHHHGHGSKYSNSWVNGKKVVYGGPWRGSNTPSHYGGGGYKHKASHEGGKLDYYHQRHGNSTREEHRKGDYHHDDKHGKGKYDKEAHDKENHGKEAHDKQKHDKNNEKKKHEKDAPTGTNKNDWKKKTAEGYQAKGIENIVPQNNASTPIEMAAVDSAASASASNSASASATQKAPASGSTSAVAGASAKNAAATSTSASHPPSSSSHSASSATSSTPASAASNTRQVALSFVAAVAATAVWCLA